MPNLHSQRQIFERFLKTWQGGPSSPILDAQGDVWRHADMQMTALADMIQAALMLKHNGRKVG